MSIEGSIQEFYAHLTINNAYIHLLWGNIALSSASDLHMGFPNLGIEDVTKTKVTDFWSWVLVIEF